MAESDFLAKSFEENREQLRSVAYRMLGSLTEADDALQESWRHLNRSDTSDVKNAGGWLTTVVARVCLDMLRSRKSRENLPPPEPREAPDPAQEALLADAVAPALLVVLETLTPAERLAFVLHDMFDVPFEEIAPIVGRSPVATRKLASRARSRVQGGAKYDAELAQQRQVVEAFLAASREGNFEALLAVLDPDGVLRADNVVVETAEARAAHGAPALAKEVRGAKAVADAFKGRAQAAQLALVDGAAGATWAPGGQPRAVFAFKIAGGKVVELNLLMDSARLSELDVELLTD